MYVQYNIQGYVFWREFLYKEGDSGSKWTQGSVFHGVRFVDDTSLVYISVTPVDDVSPSATWMPHYPSDLSVYDDMSDTLDNLTCTDPGKWAE